MDARLDWRSDGYRAIGRWMVEFSRLIGGMRTNMENRLGGDRTNDHQLLVPLAFAGAHAGQIADSFFGMCRLAAALDAAEENIANQLQKAVADEISLRNKLAHGDWLISRANEPDSTETHLIKIYAKEPHRRVETYNSKDLDKLSDRLAELSGKVWTFGGIALGFPFLKASGGLAKPGEYRVGDVLIAENVPKSGKGGQVVIAGPRASELA